MDLEAIAENDESQEVEFKQILELDTDGKKREFAKDISAMANSVRNEGLIIIGISKDGKLIGIPKDPKLVERAQQVNRYRCLPPVTFFSEWVKHNNEYFLALRLPKSDLVPHAIDRTEVYVRHDTVVDKATPDEIVALKRGSRDNPQESKDPATALYFVEKYDPMFFPLSGAPHRYRTIKVSGPYGEPGTCPIFMPHFGLHTPEPEIGETKSAVMFDEEFDGGPYDRETLDTFLHTLEDRVQGTWHSAGSWRVYPMSWGLLEHSNRYSYGLSASNAMSAIESVDEGVFAAILQFERVNVYKPTNWLALLCEIRSHEDGRFHIRNFGMKLFLSSIPLSKEWVASIFESASVLEDQNAKPISVHTVSDDAVMENMYTLHWSPSDKEARKANIIGMLGRDRGQDSDYDDGLGITVKSSTFKGIKFQLDEEDSWHTDAYKDSFDKVPTECFDELVMEVTNPIPKWIDMKKGTVKMRAPRIKMAVLGIAGYLVTPINIHSFSAR